MTIYNKPDAQIFAKEAKQGEITTFPDIARGWGVTLDTTNGIPPMEFFNALQNRTDEALGYLMQRGVAEWREDLEYPKFAITILNGQVFFAKQQNTNKNPFSNPEIWVNSFAQKANVEDVYNKQEIDDLIGAQGATSIENLRTIEPKSNGERITLLSYYEGGTTGGGEFVADTSDKSASDNGGTVIVTSAGNRWKRVFKELSPFDFGAKIGVDSTQSFRNAAGFLLNLRGNSFMTDVVSSSMKNGEIILSNSLLLTNEEYYFHNFKFSNLEMNIGTFTNGHLTVRDNQATLTIATNKQVLQNRLVIIDINESEVEKNIEVAITKGVWIVQSSSNNSAILTRTLKPKRYVNLSVDIENIPGQFKQYSAKISATSTIKFEGEFDIAGEFEQDIEFNEVVGRVNLATKGEVKAINSTLRGELHSIDSLRNGIYANGSTLNMQSSSVINSVLNGIFSTKTSNCIFDNSIVMDAGYSGFYCHRSSSISAYKSYSILNGTKGQTGSIGVGFESEASSSLFCDGSIALYNDSYGFYANASSRMSCGDCISQNNHHGYYVILSANMYARRSKAINSRKRGFYSYAAGTLSANDSFAQNSGDFDYVAQGGSVIYAENTSSSSTYSPAKDLNGLNKIVSTGVHTAGIFSQLINGGIVNIVERGITITTDLHIIRGLSSDSVVDTIKGREMDGAIVMLRNLSMGKPTVITSTGNIQLAKGDCKLFGYADRVGFIYDSVGKKWVEFFRNV